MRNIFPEISTLDSVKSDYVYIFKNVNIVIFLFVVVTEYVGFFFDL